MVSVELFASRWGGIAVMVCAGCGGVTGEHCGTWNLGLSEFSTARAMIAFCSMLWSRGTELRTAMTWTCATIERGRTSAVVVGGSEVQQPAVLMSAAGLNHKCKSRAQTLQTSTSRPADARESRSKWLVSLASGSIGQQKNGGEIGRRAFAGVGQRHGDGVKSGCVVGQSGGARTSDGLGSGRGKGHRHPIAKSPETGSLKMPRPGLGSWTLGSTVWRLLSNLAEQIERVERGVEKHQGTKLGSRPGHAHAGRERATLAAKSSK